MERQHQAADPHVVQRVREDHQRAGHGVVEQHLPEVRQARLEEQHRCLAEVVADSGEVEAPELCGHRLEGVAVRPAEPHLTPSAEHPWHPWLISEQSQAPHSHGSVVAALEHGVAALRHLRAVHCVGPPRLLHNHGSRDHRKEGSEQELRQKHAHEHTQSEQQVRILWVAIGFLQLSCANLLVDVPTDESAPCQSEEAQSTQGQVLCESHGAGREATPC
mmetsp:Transcript_57987/g.149241  ORF Transcript_57987/g.149241 Transcript_57987/m.149241 type:complete len:219 (+) Transcript_57987:432-1088(+)